MSLPEFNTREDLNDYLLLQEKRIRALEQANAELIGEVKKRFVHKDELFMILSERIPNTGLFNRNFIKRAFTVWGHYFVAQLLIALISGAFYFVIFILLLGTFGFQ
jgi:hypothetical protein